jgi:hypothetical protein
MPLETNPPEFKSVMAAIFFLAKKETRLSKKEAYNQLLNK